jgi:hypothetical protein
MLKLYQFEIENNDDGLDYLAKLEVLKKLVADGDWVQPVNGTRRIWWRSVSTGICITRYCCPWKTRMQCR